MGERDFEAMLVVAMSDDAPEPTRKAAIAFLVNDVVTQFRRIADALEAANRASAPAPLLNTTGR